MKRLLTFCLALGLAGVASAQRASVKNYFFQSTPGTFVDLSTYTPDENAEPKILAKTTLGADLAEGTSLQNVFFVDGSIEEVTNFTTVTLNDSESSRNCRAKSFLVFHPASDFSFLDAKMSGFAIAAIGGILFADGSTTDENGQPTVACGKVQTDITSEKNAARLYPTDLSNDQLVNPTKGSNAPVTLIAVSDHKNGHGLWAQFDYMVNGNRWLFQIHCYENGRIDYIVGNDLGRAALQATAPGFAFTPAAIQNDKDHAVMFGPGYPAPGSNAHCWDILKDVNISEWGLKVTPDCGPEAGRTLSFIPPADAEAFTMPADPTATASGLSGKVVLNTPEAGSLESVYAVCLSITKNSDQTMAKYDFPTTKPPTAGFKNNYTTLLYVGMPSDLSQPFEMPFEAEGLAANTEYAIHVNLCYYTPGAQNPYSYSKPDDASLKVFGPFKTPTPPAPPVELPAEWMLTAATNPSVLPEGWRSDPSETTGDAAFAFKYIEPYPYILTSLNTMLTDGIASAGLITRAVRGAGDKMTATLNIRFFDFVEGWRYEPRTPQAGDSVRIDYRLDGGNWQPAATFTTLPEADAATGLITLYTTVSGTANHAVEFRYSRYTATENTANCIESVYISEEITCFPPISLTVDTANVTDTQIALRWKDLYNETASYTVAYQTADAATDAPWTQITANSQTVSLTGLNPNTAYRMKVQAVCAEGNASAFNHTPAVFATYNGLPYDESMGNVYINPSDYTTPGERGVKTYVGQLGGTWREENNNYATWGTAYSASGRTSDIAQAMGTYEEATNAILTTAKVYTHEATRLTFKLNSFSLKKDEDNHIELTANGATPTEADCRLMVAVSNHGTFTEEDVILTLTGKELNLVNQTFQFDIAETGLMQIAFFFENPVAHDFISESKFNLEVYDLAFTAIPNDYTLTLNAQPAEGGTVTGADVYAEGASVTITATPNAGYDFVAWMEGGVERSKSTTHTFRMPSANTTYTAVFRSTEDEEEHELILTASPANGGRISGDGFYFTNEDVTIQADANDGYRFVAWLTETDTLSKEATHSFKMPNRDMRLTAKFVQNTAIETLAQNDFRVSATHGQLQIRNLHALTIKSVTIYTLTGDRLARFSLNSREDLSLPVAAGRALRFVRIDTEKGAAVYKVFLP